MSSALTIGEIASVVAIGAGVTSIAANTGMIGGKGGQGQQAAQQAADPFASYRPDMAAQYAAAMAPGGTTDPTKMPGYSQFISGVLNPTLGSVQARDAASGRGWSGQEQTDMTQAASQNYYGFMTNYMNQLAQGSGAISNPAPAAQLGYQQQQSNQQGIMQGVGGIMQGIRGLSSSGSSSPGWPGNGINSSGVGYNPGQDSSNADNGAPYDPTYGGTYDPNYSAPPP